MASINTIVKRKQYLWLGIVVGHWLLGADGVDGRHPVTGMHGEPGLQPAGFW